MNKKVQGYREAFSDKLMKFCQIAGMSVLSLKRPRVLRLTWEQGPGRSTDRQSQIPAPKSHTIPLHTILKKQWLFKAFFLCIFCYFWRAAVFWPSPLLCCCCPFTDFCRCWIFCWRSKNLNCIILKMLPGKHLTISSFVIGQYPPLSTVHPSLDSWKS